MINTTVTNLHKTIIAEYEDAWECACGNRPDLDGFYPCDPTGREAEPDPNSSLDVKLLYCADCGLVMDQSTYDSTTQTVAVVGRIKTIATSKHRNSHVYTRGSFSPTSRRIGPGR